MKIYQNNSHMERVIFTFLENLKECCQYHINYVNSKFLYNSLKNSLNKCMEELDSILNDISVIQIQLTNEKYVLSEYGFINELQDIIHYIKWQVTWFQEAQYFNTGIALKIRNLNMTDEVVDNTFKSRINVLCQTLKRIRGSLYRYSHISMELKEKMIGVTYSLESTIKHRYQINMGACLHGINRSIYNICNKSEVIENNKHEVIEYLSNGLNNITPFDIERLWYLKQKGKVIAPDMEKYLDKYAEDLKMCNFIQIKDEKVIISESFNNVETYILRPLTSYYNRMFNKRFDITMIY